MKIIKLGAWGWYGKRSEGCFPTTEIVERLDVVTQTAAFHASGYDSVVFLSEDTLGAIRTGYTRLKDLRFYRTIGGK